MTNRLFLLLCALLLGLLCACPLQAAARLQASLVDASGQPLADAALSLRGPREAPAEPPQALPDQKAKQFVANLLAVRTGTAVSYANSDNIGHHVYSLSAAKRFELRLYQGTPSEPVRLDKPGVVVLGRNVHDWRVGCVYVSEDPWFAASDQQGRAPLEQMPPRRYRVSLWYPALPDRLAQSGSELLLGEQRVTPRLALAVPAAPSAFGSAFKKALGNAPQ